MGRSLEDGEKWVDPRHNLEAGSIGLRDGLDVECEGEEGATHPLKCLSWPLGRWCLLAESHQ